MAARRRLSRNDSTSLLRVNPPASSASRIGVRNRAIGSSSTAAASSTETERSNTAATSARRRPSGERSGSRDVATALTVVVHHSDAVAYRVSSDPSIAGDAYVLNGQRHILIDDNSPTCRQ